MTFVHRSWRLGLVATLALVAFVAVAPVLAATIPVSIVNNAFEPAGILSLNRSTAAISSEGWFADSRSARSVEPSAALTTLALRT